MCHPFFDELRDPETKLPDSRHNGAPRDMPELFDFSRHGMFEIPFFTVSSLCVSKIIELFTEMFRTRTVYCPSIERPSRPRSRSSCSCRSRSRPRNIQASFEGANDGTSRLSRFCAIVLGRVRLFGFFFSLSYQLRTYADENIDYYAVRVLFFNICIRAGSELGKKRDFFRIYIRLYFGEIIWELVSLKP